MKKMRQKHTAKNDYPFINLFIYLILIMTFSQAYAQTISVNGTVSVTSSNVNVQNAQVTFVDDSDTTKQYTAMTDSAGKYQIDNITVIESDRTSLPTSFKLEQNYPNPFMSTTEIPYKLNKQSDVHVTIYDILGREVRKFSYNIQGPGSHSILWNGRNDFGEKVAAGIYFYRLEAAGQSLVKKMVYGAGQNKISIPTPYISPQTSSLNKTTGVLGGTFTVRIANTDSTFPMILSQTNNNQAVQNNATIDFGVNTLYPIANLDVNLDSTLQLIRGFGAANILPWRPDMTTDEVTKAFGTGPGQLGFSILRLRVPYTDNVSEFAANIPTAKLAESMGAIVFASPWTPPPAMKSNNNIVGGTLNVGSYADYATHLKNFADYMATNGAPLYAISLQNEPDASVGYESCDWNATEFLNFCKNNAASIGIKIMMPESQNFVHQLSDSTLNDSAAAANVSIIGGHIYGGGLGPYPLAESKGKELWMTEHLDTDVSWNNVLATGLEINNCMNAGMNAYIWWYIVRFYGPIDDGTTGGVKGNVTKRGYVMSQFARFIRPGFHRVQSGISPQRNVFTSAYKDSTSKIIVVAINTGLSPVYQTFSVNGGAMTYVTPYTTSVSKNCEQGNAIKVTNGSFTAELEPSSIMTFVSN